MPQLTEDQTLCPWCSEVTDVRTMVDDPTGTDTICEPCFENIHTEDCHWCGDSDNADSMTEIGDGWLCNNCVGDSTMCIDCDDTVHMDEVSYVDGWRHSGPVCESCYDGSYFYCDNCGEHMALDNYGGEGLCSDCYEDEGYCDCGECGGGEGGIRRWGDAPDLQFHDIPFIGPLRTVYPRSMTQSQYQPQVGKYYLGMEIELEETCSSIVGPFVTRHSDHMWATTDATVDDGYEIVTMPHTFEAWMTTFPWAEWNADIHSQVPEQSNYSSNGIHIHISRTAFANSKGRVLASHLYKFMQFIRVNEAAIQMLSEREGGSYCMWDQQRDARDGMNDAKEATSTRNYERYRPVNTQNRQTIELRFFDGRSDPAFMKRALMFVHSLAEFTRYGKAHDARTWEAYTTYVSEHDDLYPELQAYLVDNRRRLVFNAMTSEYRYTDTVLPAIKQRKQRERMEAATERNRQARNERERQALLDSVDNVCTCDGCTAYANRAAEAAVPTLNDGDFIRDYMAGSFHVNVYQTQLGQRHEYRYVGAQELDAYGEYVMSEGFQGDVTLPTSILNQDVTLQREVR